MKNLLILGILAGLIGWSSPMLFSGQLETETKPAAAKKENKVYKASDLIGMNVKNASNETIGEITDLAIDEKNSTVRYAVFSSGGFLGMGEKLFAISLDKFQFNHKDKIAVLNYSKEMLERAKGIDPDHWPEDPTGVN